MVQYLVLLPAILGYTRSSKNQYSKTVFQCWLQFDSRTLLSPGPLWYHSAHSFSLTQHLLLQTIIRKHRATSADDNPLWLYFRSYFQISFSIAFGSDFQSSIPRILQLSLTPSAIHPSQLTGKCLLSPPWMFLSHYVSTVHQRVSMSHVDNMFGAEALLHTGLDLCLEHFRAQSSIIKTVMQIYLAQAQKILWGRLWWQHPRFFIFYRIKYKLPGRFKSSQLFLHFWDLLYSP